MLFVIPAVGIDGSAVIVIDEVAVHPLAPVAVTVYVFADVNVLFADVVVVPPSQLYVTPPVAVTSILFIIQVSSVTPVLFVILTVGAATSSVIVIDDDAVHPFDAVAVTVYVPVAVNVFASVVGVEPPSQLYVTPPVAVTLIDVVAQVKTFVPELLVIDAVGIDGSAVIAIDDVAVQPLASVAVTV